MASRFHGPLLAACLFAGAGLGACATSPFGDDFGRAVNAEKAAQIANPAATYAGNPDPGTDGSRAALAQTRYQTGTVLKPSSAGAATNVKSDSGAGGGAAPAN
jgi:hypothetical protein